MVLKPAEVRSFYDRFGKKQDTQCFYEDPALDDLVVHANLGGVEEVFEFGCGTGRFAARLLENHLPASATYVGCDLSPVMVGLATKRLAGYGTRARVLQTNGAVHFPLSSHSVDRVVSTYVLDLLSEPDIREFLGEACRVLKVGGRLCLVSLTNGTTFLSRLVTSVWTAIYHFRASLVGGCRPVHLEQYFKADKWEVEYRRVVIAFGVPSEVIVACVKAGKAATPAQIEIHSKIPVTR